MSGIVKLVHRVDDPDGPFYTVSEVAEYFERSSDTIRRWAKTLGIPNYKMPLGEGENNFVWLYTDEDLKVLEIYSADINPKGGRPRKEETGKE